MSNEEHSQFNLERQRMLEDAIERAENNQASQDDYDIIRFESGLPSKRRSHSSQVLDDVFADFASIFGGR
jgi:folate-binding Fe-S cluster repair protein YgfZ